MTTDERPSADRSPSEHPEGGEHAAVRGVLVALSLVGSFWAVLASSAVVLA